MHVDGVPMSGELKQGMTLREEAQLAAEDAGYNKDSNGWATYITAYLAGYQEGAASKRETLTHRERGSFFYD